MSSSRVLFVIGTRPEAIKLAPVIREMRTRAREGASVAVKVCATAQQRELLDQMLEVLGIIPDCDLGVMRPGQTPGQVAAAVLSGLEPLLAGDRFDWVIVQGDTTTVAAASLAAYYAGVRVGHVEAGLRTHDKWRPFPEELNRRVAGVTADLHFAPTERARAHLLAEGVPEDRVLVTGNPGIDAVQWAARQPFDASALEPRIAETLGRSGARVLLVTAHRRESFGGPLESICSALEQLARRGICEIVFPVHPNPEIRGPVEQLLAGIPHLVLVPALDYLSMVHVLQRCHAVLPDSGGLQEEAPAFGKPVLVLRDVTERPEALEAGASRLVGTASERIVAEVTHLLSDDELYARMSRARNPFGDGRAAGRIAEAILGRP
jgi:UDP-N-acetylglucosamine 2-epimerase (non-hydrolysing)